MIKPKLPCLQAKKHATIDGRQVAAKVLIFQLLREGKPQSQELAFASGATKTQGLAILYNTEDHAFALPHQRGQLKRLPRLNPESRTRRVAPPRSRGTPLHPFGDSTPRASPPAVGKRMHPRPTNLGAARHAASKDPALLIIQNQGFLHKVQKAPTVSGSDWASWPKQLLGLVATKEGPKELQEDSYHEERKSFTVLMPSSAQCYSYSSYHGYS